MQYLCIIMSIELTLYSIAVTEIPQMLLHALYLHLALASNHKIILLHD